MTPGTLNIESFLFYTTAMVSQKRNVIDISFDGNGIEKKLNNLK